jgi:Matrixin
MRRVVGVIRWAYVATLLLALLTCVQTARAFSLWPNSTSRWAGTSLPMHWDITFMSMGTGFINDANQAIWDWDAPTMFFTFYTCDQSCPWATHSWDYGGINPLTQTSITFDGSGHISGYSQNVNRCSCIAWYTGTGTVPSNQLDFITDFRHEMGHLLGLCHSGTPGTLMYYSQNYGERKYVGPDAQNGSNYLYDRPPYNGPGPESPHC